MNTSNNMVRSKPLLRRGQRGVSLIFTLIALVVLMLTSIALVRSVDTATLVMGNLGFKQDTTNQGSNSASGGSEAAVAWITANYASLTATQGNVGYYASSLDDLDPTGAAHDATLAAVDWNEDQCASLTTGTDYNGTCKVASPKVAVLDATGQKTIAWAKYMISRLCSADGSPTGKDVNGNAIVCSRPTSVGTTTSTGKGAVDVKSPFSPGAPVVGPYFRIVVRVQDLRNTVSFTETLVHF